MDSTKICKKYLKSNTAASCLIKHHFRPPGFARGQSSFSTQVLIGAARGLSSLSRFACTFFFLAWGIGAARFFLFCPSAIETVSACYHKNILLLLFAKMFRHVRFQGI